ncbi:MAG: hypothetical protein ABL908_18050, partial [Hyphomicrobium sp.]
LGRENAAWKCQSAPARQRGYRKLIAPISAAMKSRRSSAGLVSFSGTAMTVSPFRLNRSKSRQIPVQEQVAGVRLVRREASEPDAGVEERLKIQKRAVLVCIDDQRVPVDALGFHVDGDGADRWDADQEIRALDLAAQGLGDRERRLLDVDVGQAAPVQPTAKPVLGCLSLRLALHA